MLPVPWDLGSPSVSGSPGAGHRRDTELSLHHPRYGRAGGQQMNRKGFLGSRSAVVPLHGNSTNPRVSAHSRTPPDRGDSRESITPRGWVPRGGGDEHPEHRPRAPPRPPADPPAGIARLPARLTRLAGLAEAPTGSPWSCGAPEPRRGGRCLRAAGSLRALPSSPPGRGAARAPHPSPPPHSPLHQPAPPPQVCSAPLSPPPPAPPDRSQTSNSKEDGGRRHREIWAVRMAEREKKII